MNQYNKTIASEILSRIENYQVKYASQKIGKVLKVSDGVCYIAGLSQVQNSEIIKFPGNIYGVTLNLEKDQAGAIILGDWSAVSEGDEVTATGRLLSIPVGKELIGRVIDPLGNPLDSKGKLKLTNLNPVEKIAPDVTKRYPVNTPVQTGIISIDSMIPIGRGQRELIIGDRGVGKTQIALDTIINQKKENLVCIYVAIGQKSSRIAQVIDQLTRHQAMDYTIVVSACASDPVSFQYLAPFAGCAIGEYFLEKGMDALVVYDDLSKHAWAYRQISLILRRPSGREAYPGDIFYLHSRLLERACRVDEKYGGGSLTALPIIETQAGDVSAYIPTNVISITDGQIYLESDLFYAGIRPAINVGLSVSRVGGNAQIKPLRRVAGSLRLDLAQFRALASFSQFSSDLDPATRQQLDRGMRLQELLKQAQFSPLPVEEQIVVIFAGTQGYCDTIAVDQLSQFKKDFLEYFREKHNKLLVSIKKEAELSDAMTAELKKAISAYLNKYSK